MPNITNNRINTSITPADQTLVNQHFLDIAALLPFLLGLEADEKKGTLGINLSNKQFVEDCLTEMNQDPSLLPGFINVGAVRTDYDLYLQLDPMIVRAKDLLDRLSDTQFLAGAEAYSICLIYYRIAEAAAKAGLPGADERYNRLKERFAAQGIPNTPGPVKPNPTPFPTPNPTPPAP